MMSIMIERPPKRGTCGSNTKYDKDDSSSYKIIK